MNIRGAIFDLDGTLTDSMYIWQKAPVDLMRRYGGDPPEDLARDLKEMGRREAAEYLRRYALRQEALPGYMRVLQLGDRAPSASEEKYLSAWQEMGFEPEAVAIAYDKTVLRCHEFKWPYCNGILKKWHEAGLHTAQEIREKDHPPRSREETPAASGGDEMWKYVQQLRRDREVTDHGV